MCYTDIEEKLNKLLHIRLFKDKYLDYFMNRHIPGTEYKNEFKELGNFISQYTGASNLFTGSGVTVSSRGLENIERGFTRYKDYKIVSNLVRNFDSEKSHISIMLR